MPAIDTNATNTTTATAPVANPAPAATVAAPAKPVASPKRKPNTAKRASGVTVTTKPAATTTAKPAPVKPAGTEPAKPSANVNRTASTIAAERTNFGGVISDRDTAYIAFYASLAKRAANGVVTVRGIVESGRKPAYNGSNKPHDAGVIVRLSKAGIVKHAADGHSFTFTEAGKRLGAYTSAKA